MRHVTLFVGGMLCRRSVRQVTARLRDVPGVETVSAATGEGVVRLTGTMRVEDLLDAVDGTGYPPRLEGSDGDSDETEDGKSRD
jgi:copper chaperone CopZ